MTLCLYLVVPLPQGTYYEAFCTSVYPVRKEVVACFPGDVEDCFKISYDILIMGVSTAPHSSCSSSNRSGIITWACDAAATSVCVLRGSWTGIALSNALHYMQHAAAVCEHRVGNPQPATPGLSDCTKLGT